MSDHMGHINYEYSGVESIGDIPRGWTVKRMKDVCIVNPNKSEVQLSENTEITFLPMENILSVGKINTSIVKEYSEISGGYTYFREGDVILAKVTPCFENGNIAIAKGLVNGIAFGTTELHVIRAKSICDNRYIFYLVQSNRFRLEGIASMYGVAGLKRIPSEFVENYKFALPSRNEQVQISHFLDLKTTEIDSLIADKEKLIVLLEEQRQAIITEAVTKGLNPNVKLKDSGVEWIGKIPEGWDITRIKFVSKVISKGTTPSTVGRDLLEDGRIKYIKAENIVNNTLVEQPGFFIDDETDYILKRSRLMIGDVLIVIAGATIGKTAIVTDKFFPSNSNQAVAYIRLNNKVDSTYLWYYLQSDIVSKIIAEKSVQSAQPNLSLSDIGDMTFFMPNLTEQILIMDFLEKKNKDLDKLKNSLFIQIQKLKEYRQSLIFEAVTGKIDVRDIAVNGAVTV